MRNKISSLSILFPVYKDSKTIDVLIKKSISLCDELNLDYEIVIVDDCCPEKSGEIVRSHMENNNKIKLVTHETNKGYGESIKSGLKLCTKNWILQTDGDNQYDVYDLKKMLKIVHNYDCIITFRYKKIYSSFRIFISWVYNKVIQFLFNSKFRDISTGLRLINNEALKDISLTSKNAFIGAEIANKLMLKGYQVGEMGISTYPRQFGVSTIITLQNIFTTIQDINQVRKEIFR